MGITALLVKVNLGSPVLFTQQRPGQNEKIFKIYKYRTMTDKKDENGELLPDEKRLTKFGQFYVQQALMNFLNCLIFLKVICPLLDQDHY